jgi:hypothetical protein
MTALTKALKEMNKNPEVWTVPRKGSYHHEHLMKLVRLNKKAVGDTKHKEETEHQRMLRYISNAEQNVKKY